MVFCYIENGLDNGFHAGRPGISSLALALPDDDVGYWYLIQ
jgi:hypothetical protein